MQLTTLDQITRRSLLEKNLPLHYYFEYLVHGASAIRELSKDTLKIVNSANLPLNGYNAVDLPSDFVDDIGVYIPVGGALQPIPKRDNINPIRVHDGTSGAFEPYNNGQSSNSGEFTFFGINTSYFWYWNVNDFGEPTGRYFGANGGAYQNGYKVIKERRQIQFTGTFTSDNVVLLYISNGQSADNATQVDWLAFRAIQTYTEWQRSPNANFKDSPEARTFYNEKRLLRAELNPLTREDIINTIRSGYTAAMKS